MLRDGGNTFAAGGPGSIQPPYSPRVIEEMAKQKKSEQPVETPEASKLPLLFITVLTAAQRLVKGYEEWSRTDSAELNVGWRGQVVKSISKSLHALIQQEVDNCADAGRDVEPKGRKLLLIIDDLAKAFRQWLMDASMELDTAPPRGNTDMHNAFLRLAEALKSTSFKQPPAIKQLYEIERVSLNQIARIYGWRTEDGGEDTDKVIEEMANPGTHYDPKTWLPPHLVLEQAEIDAAWEQHEPREALYSTAQTESGPVVPDDEKLSRALEDGTFNEYLTNGASIDQMVRYFKAEAEEIEMIADERGYVLVNDCFKSKALIETEAKQKAFQEAI